MYFQIEYYFGDYNLPKDKWMLEKLEDLEGGTVREIFKNTIFTYISDHLTRISLKMFREWLGVYAA